MVEISNWCYYGCYGDNYKFFAGDHIICDDDDDDDDDDD